MLLLLFLNHHKQSRSWKKKNKKIASIKPHLQNNKKTLQSVVKKTTTRNPSFICFDLICTLKQIYNTLIGLDEWIYNIKYKIYTIWCFIAKDERRSVKYYYYIGIWYILGIRTWSNFCPEKINSIIIQRIKKRKWRWLLGLQFIKKKKLLTQRCVTYLSI